MTRRGLELVWPGKYDADGQRVAVPRRQPTLQRDGVFVGPDGTVRAADGGEQLDFVLAGSGQTRAPPRDPCAVHPGAADRLIAADNLLALDGLHDALGDSVDLIVLDPPFSTGSRFDVVTRVGEGPSPAEIRAPAYSDSWEGGAAGLIAMLDPRIRLAHALLAPHGSLYLHVDPTVGHAVKLLLDDVFGPDSFQREIVWRIGWLSGFKTKARNWIRNHDLIFFYVKDPGRFTFNKHYMPYPEGYVRRDGLPPKGQGVPLDDVWNANDVEQGLRGPDSLDSIQIKSFSHEKTGFATQKNESLLRRIIEASSNPGDLVLDPFCGSGTTLAVARALGRRCIGIDTSRAAIQIALRRLLTHPGPAIAVEHAHAGERSELADDTAAVLAQADAHACDAPGIDGLRDGVGIAVIADRVADGSDLAAAQQAARNAGLPGAQVLAWAWSLVVPVHTQGVHTSTAAPEAFAKPCAALVVERDIFGPRPRAREGLSPLAAPHVRVSPMPGGLRVELLGLTEGWPALRPPVAAELPTEGLDLVDGWAIDCSGHEPPRFSFASFRDHHRRALLSAVDIAPSGAAIRIRVWDVLHRTVDVVLRLDGASPRRVVQSAELQAGPGSSFPTR